MLFALFLMLKIYLSSDEAAILVYAQGGLLYCFPESFCVVFIQLNVLKLSCQNE